MVVVGHDSSALAKVIKTCFDKLLGNQMLNANLMFRVQDVVLGALVNANKIVQQNHDIHLSVEDLTA